MKVVHLFWDGRFGTITLEVGDGHYRYEFNNKTIDMTTLFVTDIDEAEIAHQYAEGAIKKLFREIL